MKNMEKSDHFIESLIFSSKILLIFTYIDNFISNTGLKCIKTLYKSCSKLKELYLDGNKFDQEGMLCLNEYLDKNPEKLELISLNSIYIYLSN